MTILSTDTPIKIFIVDDHHVIREGLKGFFSKQKSILTVGEASDGYEALKLIPKFKPDVILMDIKMPGLDGLTLMRKIHEQYPDIRVLIVSVYDNRDLIMGAIQSGASGYILKDFFPSDLLQAIQSIHQGKTYFPKNILEKLGQEYSVEQNGTEKGRRFVLSKREKEVLHLIVQGQSNKQIAATLGIGVRTVETYREKIMDKLDIHSTSGLVRFALSSHLFDEF